MPSGGQGDVGTDTQICDSLGVKLLTRLRFEFSHLNEHKFRHGFKDTLNPYVLVELKLKPLNTSSCIVNYTPLIDLNSLIRL